jgi:hypothetical protein
MSATGLTEVSLGAGRAAADPMWLYFVHRLQLQREASMRIVDQ